MPTPGISVAGTRRATERFVVAIIATVGGALAAVLAGVPEAATLVAPWMVLLTLGITNAVPRRVRATVEVEADRVLVGDDIDVVTTVTGAEGSVQVTCLPSDGFVRAEPCKRHKKVDPRRSARAAEPLVVDRAVVRCPLPASEWGTHDLGRVRIEITEPYGLFRWTRVVREPSGSVRVHPTPTELQDLLAPWLVRRVSGVHGSKAVGRGVEYADIRPFGAGDTLRDINWRASARSSDLWVSQRHPERATDVILLLDTFVESGHDVRTVVGLSIEAAVALAESHLAVADRVGLVELGGLVRWVSPGSGRMHLQRLTDVLLATGLHANLARRGLRMIPPRALPPRSFVVALTPLLDEGFIDALFILGARGHDVAVVECASVLPDGEDSASDLQQPAVRLWEAERQVVRDRLAEHGIAVAPWHEGEHLDLTLAELTRRRKRAVQAVRR